MLQAPVAKYARAIGRTLDRWVHLENSNPWRDVENSRQPIEAFNRLDSYGPNPFPSWSLELLVDLAPWDSRNHIDRPHPPYIDDDGIIFPGSVVPRRDDVNLHSEGGTLPNLHHKRSKPPKLLNGALYSLNEPPDPHPTLLAPGPTPTNSPTLKQAAQDVESRAARCRDQASAKRRSKSSGDVQVTHPRRMPLPGPL